MVRRPGLPFLGEVSLLAVVFASQPHPYATSVAIPVLFFAIELCILFQITKTGRHAFAFVLPILFSQTARTIHLWFRDAHTSKVGFRDSDQQPNGGAPRESDESYQSHRQYFRNLNPVWSNYHGVTLRLPLVYESTVFVLISVTSSVFSDER